MWTRRVQGESSPPHFLKELGKQSRLSGAEGWLRYFITELRQENLVELFTFGGVSNAQQFDCLFRFVWNFDEMFGELLVLNEK